MVGLLQSQADFVSALDALRPSPVLALDTEFMRERSPAYVRLPNEPAHLAPLPFLPKRKAN